MTAVVVIETVILLVLCVLVLGLLRSYATVLERLHRMDGGLDGDPVGSSVPAGGSHPTPGTARPLPFPTVNGVMAPPAVLPRDGVSDHDDWAPAHDVVGQGLAGDIISVRTVAVEHDTVILFLSSGCSGCAGFWEQLADRRGVAATGSTRLLVVTKSSDEESVGLLGALRPPGLDLIMSSSAWADYAVPGSPYVIVVDGPSGRVKGMGSGTSLSQVSGLMQQAYGDGASAPVLGPVNPGPGHRMSRSTTKPIVKPRSDTERETDVDTALLAAGIYPGHPSLYPTGSPSTTRPGAAR